MYCSKREAYVSLKSYTQKSAVVSAWTNRIAFTKLPAGVVPTHMHIYTAYFVEADELSVFFDAVVVGNVAQPLLLNFHFCVVEIVELRLKRLQNMSSYCS